MPGQDFKALFSEDDWLSLQATILLVCRDAPNGWADGHGWHEVGRTIKSLAVETTRSEHSNNLILTILTCLADDMLRNELIDHVRDIIAKRSDADLRALTERAGRAVDRVCPEQGFGFRATLILIETVVADQVIKPK